jgi:hypothetical protein
VHISNLEAKDMYMYLNRHFNKKKKKTKKKKKKKRRTRRRRNTRREKTEKEKKKESISEACMLFDSFRDSKI